MCVRIYPGRALPSPYENWDYFLSSFSCNDFLCPGDGNAYKAIQGEFTRGRYSVNLAIHSRKAPRGVYFQVDPLSGHNFLLGIILLFGHYASVRSVKCKL